VITNESIDVPKSQIEIDPATQEWLEFFEGPSLPLLSQRPSARPVVADPPGLLDPRTADWRSTQHFPVVPLLQGAVRSARTPEETGVRRPLWKSRGWQEPCGSAFASNLVVEAMLRSGGDYVVVQQT